MLPVAAVEGRSSFLECVVYYSIVFLSDPTHVRLGINREIEEAVEECQCYLLRGSVL
jgi:hypothetical protein